MTGAIGHMVVHQSHTLHKGITDSRADKGKPGFFQRLAHGFGSSGFSRNLFHTGVTVDYWLTIDKTPEKFDKIDALLFQCQ